MLLVGVFVILPVLHSWFWMTVVQAQVRVRVYHNLFYCIIDVVTVSSAIHDHSFVGLRLKHFAYSKAQTVRW